VTITGNTLIHNQAIYDGGGIYVSDYNTLLITGNTLHNNRAIWEASGGGIYLHHGGTATISGNTITANYSRGSGGGIVATDATVISHNTISGNEARNSGGGISACGTVTISHNIIRYNLSAQGDGGGIRGGTAIDHNLIVGNSAARDGGGLYEGGTVSHNLILGNFAGVKGGGIASGGIVHNNIIVDNRAAIYEGGISAASQIITNTILRNTAENNVAIRYGGDGEIRANTILDNRATGSEAPRAVYVDWGHPDVHHNNIYNNSDYALYNHNEHGTPDLDAKDNWWGTADPAEIADLIYDWFDDPSRGVVDYDPWLGEHHTEAPLSPPIGLAAAPGENSITLTWTPNPESDLAGYKVYYDLDAGFPYSGTGAREGESPVDVEDVTSFTLTDLTPATYYLAVTAYDADADGVDDQTDGHESWYSLEESVALVSQPPAVGTFAPDGGSGRVERWARFTTTFSDPNGYDDITWAFFFLDRAPPIVSGGLLVAYNQTANVLWLWGASPTPSCQPGQSAFKGTAYATLSCRHTTVSGAGDTLTIAWAVRPEQCFEGGCGENTAYEYVVDSTGLFNAGTVGTWTLYPAGGEAATGPPAIQPNDADWDRLRSDIEAWLAER
jgi:hypothetical protein